MKKTIVLISVLIVAVATAFFVYVSNPLRKSSEELREVVLKVTPIGISMDDVLKIIEKNKEWKILQDGKWQSCLRQMRNCPYCTKMSLLKQNK